MSGVDVAETPSSAFTRPDASDSGELRRRGPPQMPSPDNAPPSPNGSTHARHGKSSLSTVFTSDDDADEKPSDSSSASLNPGGPESPSKANRHLLNIAPLNTPLQSRLETFGVIWHTISIPFFACLFLFTLSLGVVFWITIIIPYMIWWYGFDLHTPTNGKAVYRKRDWMKNLIVWEWFARYFPINVHKSVDLTPTFTDVRYQEDSDAEVDEEDLISEEAITFIDRLFKLFGLKKRLNQSSSGFEVVEDEKDDNASSTTSKKPVKYTKVPTGPRYIFGYHPHGVISMGAMGTFATNAIRNEPWKPPLPFLKPFFHDPSKGERLLPGIGNVFPLTLTTQFTIPFYRDYLLSLGLTSASAKNIKSLINNGDNSVCIVVGGARESLLNNMVSSHTKVGRGYKGKEIVADSVHEDENTNEALNNGDSDESSIKSANGKRQCRLVLNNRKGFVKLAIELGNISLVPTFAFGEVDIYKLTIPKKDSWGYKFQQWVKLNFQFTIPFFSARGVFIYDFGFLPYRNPINICMGRPIHIPASALADYKVTHPEFDDGTGKSPAEEEPKAETKEKLSGIIRTESFTSLFKLNSKPKRPSAKVKIPQELLDHYHSLYIEELRRVYEENKDKFGYGDVELVIQ